MDEHVPVLYKEILFYLRPSPGGKYIDGTVGAGGHAAGLLERSQPGGSVLGLDRDAAAIEYCRVRFSEAGRRMTLVSANYIDMEKVARQHDFSSVDGIVLDLGLSSRQLAAAERGFSFQQDGPLDMRFDTTRGATAADLLNTMNESALANIFWRYGEIRQSRKVAQAIVDARPVTTTGQLANVIGRLELSKGRRSQTRRIHPATRVFQALRIAVNDELTALESVLPDTINLLRPGGRLAVISFHSLEDRIVKQFMRDQSRACVCPPGQPICTCQAQSQLRRVTRKVVRPTEEEIAKNPRSRSARLRVAEKLDEDVE